MPLAHLKAIPLAFYQMRARGLCSTTLYKSTGDTARKRGAGRTAVKAPTVTSSTLCDDIITRLAPSLSSHAGCTVIDINPGPGLFSSKVHELLKPKSHILVEPVHDYHQPFLRPLVDGPNSTYQLRDWPTNDAFRIQRYFEEGFLEQRQQCHSKPVPCMQVNTSILLLANLARTRSPKRPHRSLIKPAHHHILNFLHDLRNLNELHSQGPIRMLAWVVEPDKDVLLPKSVGLRKKITLQVESGFHVEEVAGSEKRSRICRERGLDIKSCQVVASRMENSKVEIPPDRQSSLQKEARSTIVYLPSDRQGLSPDIIPRDSDWKAELRQLEKDFSDGRFSQIEGGPPGPHEARRKHGREMLTSTFRRLRELRNTNKLLNKKTNIIEDLLQNEAKLDQLDCELLHSQLSTEERNARDAERGSIARNIQATLDSKGPSLTTQFHFISDDRRAFAKDPPLLMWDRRMAEPVIAHKGEFSSSTPLALLDFQPRAPSQYPLTSMQMNYFDWICTSLLYSGNQTVNDLAQTAPGAFEALTPQVPALKDPLKGGRRDLNSLRSRCLTLEMMYQLSLAWERWPFKPPEIDLTGKWFYGLNREYRDVRGQGHTSAFEV